MRQKTERLCRCYNDVLQKHKKENSEQEQPVLQLSRDPKQKGRCPYSL
jgi:hypothetical protein